MDRTGLRAPTRLFVVGLDNSEPAVTGVLDLTDGRVEADTGAAWLLDGFFAVLPTSGGPIQVLPSEGYLFLVACWYSLQGHRTWGELEAADGLPIDRDEAMRLVDAYTADAASGTPVAEVDIAAAKSSTEHEFDEAMQEIYDRAGHEIGYWATRYLQMLRRYGGLATARKLLAAKTTSDGYARLREAGRLDLTVETYVLKPEFESLFSKSELDLARARLATFERMSVIDGFTALDPALLSLVEEAAAADPGTRVEDYRDLVAAYGVQAVPAMIA